MASSTNAAATRRLVLPRSLISGFAVATWIYPQGERHEPSTGDLSPSPTPLPPVCIDRSQG
jgi:hypothetical protein